MTRLMSVALTRDAVIETQQLDIPDAVAAAMALSTPEADEDGDR